MPVVNSTKEKAKAKVASLARSVMILNGCLKGLKMLVKIEKKLFIYFTGIGNHGKL